MIPRTLAGVSTLTADSTLDEVKAAYRNAASYAEDRSATKALAFVTAAEILLIMLPQRVTHGGRDTSEIQLDLGQIKEAIERARKWLAINAGVTAGGAGVVHCDLSDLRS